MRTLLRFTLAGLIAFGWTTASLQAAAAGVTTVFVGTPAPTQPPSRLTAELAASAADLRKALQKQAALRLVDTPEAAHVILSVQDRQRNSNLAGTVAWGDDLGSGPTYNSWARLTVEVKAGGLSKSMVAQAKTWRGAASRAAGDVAKWVDANRRVLTPGVTSRD